MGSIGLYEVDLVMFVEWLFRLFVVAWVLLEFCLLLVDC